MRPSRTIARETGFSPCLLPEAVWRRQTARPSLQRRTAFNAAQRAPFLTWGGRRERGERRGPGGRRQQNARRDCCCLGLAGRMESGDAAAPPPTRPPSCGSPTPGPTHCNPKDLLCEPRPEAPPPNNREGPDGFQLHGPFGRSIVWAVVWGYNDFGGGILG